MNNFQSSNETNTSVSTLQISEKKESLDRVHTYIHTYMEKRTKKDNTKNTNVTFYDGKDLVELQELSFRNKTNVSSVVSNLVREFVLLSKDSSPQKTLFDFGETETVMDFYHESKTWDTYIRESSKDEKQRIKQQIILIDKILGRYI